MKKAMKKFFISDEARRNAVKRDLVHLFNGVQGVQSSFQEHSFKIEVSSGKDSSVTAIQHDSGNLVVMGHGHYFDLTSSICSLYHNNIPNNTNFVAPTRKETDHRKIGTRKGPQSKPRTR